MLYAYSAKLVRSARQAAACGTKSSVRHNRPMPQWARVGCCTAPIVTAVPAVELGEWGDPANVIAIAGVAITLTTAFLAALSSRRTRQKGQAEQIACWVERAADGRLSAIVRNSSQQQIRDVLLNITPPEASSDRDPSLPTHHRSAGDIGVQVIPVPTIAPQRTVTYPVRVSVGRDVLPRLVMHFRDTSGRGWLRDDHGRLRPYKSKLSASPFGSSVTTGTATVEDEAQTLSQGSEGSAPISRTAYSTTVMSAAAGNQMTVLLVPKRTQVEAEASSTLSLGSEMKATVIYGGGDTLLSVTFHNLKPKRNRDAARNFRIVHLDAYDTLVLVFHEREVDDSLDDAEFVLPIPCPSGGHVGEAMLAADGQPLLVRILNASRHLHPEIWRAA